MLIKSSMIRKYKSLNLYFKQRNSWVALSNHFFCHMEKNFCIVPGLHHALLNTSYVYTSKNSQIQHEQSYIRWKLIEYVMPSSEIEKLVSLLIFKFQFPKND